MRLALPLLAAALFAVSTLAADVDAGAVDQKAPKKEVVAAPKKADGVPTVGLRETVKAKVGKGEKRNVYVLINPLGKENKPTYWWVQAEVTKDGEAVTCDAQFGEEDAGVGEYFVVVVIATDRKWSPGDKQDDLPDDAAYSKVKVVKRK